MAETKSPTKENRERKERFATLSGLPLERLYTEESLAGWDAEEALGYPGEFPYTRGIYPSMYRGRLWTMRQYAGFGSAAESNQRYRYLLSKGQSGLSVAFDLPTQIGLDSDHPLASGEVGKVGVAIDSIEDMLITAGAAAALGRLDRPGIGIVKTKRVSTGVRHTILALAGKGRRSKARKHSSKSSR